MYVHLRPYGLTLVVLAFDPVQFGPPGGVHEAHGHERGDTAAAAENEPSPAQRYDAVSGLIGVGIVVEGDAWVIPGQEEFCPVLKARQVPGDLVDGSASRCYHQDPGRVRVLREPHLFRHGCKKLPKAVLADIPVVGGFPALNDGVFHGVASRVREDRPVPSDPVPQIVEPSPGIG